MKGTIIERKDSEGQWTFFLTFPRLIDAQVQLAYLQTHCSFMEWRIKP